MPSDRGVPSFQGRPADVDRRTYFGNPDDSRVNARVDVVSASVEHQAGGVTIRERTSIPSASIQIGNVTLLDKRVDETPLTSTNVPDCFNVKLLRQAEDDE